MKKLKIFMKIFIIFIGIFFITNFCKKEIPECEKTNTGDIKVTNGTPFLIYVDVTSVEFGFNSQRPLYPYESTTYTMPEGTIYCYAANQTNYDNNKWNEKIESCTQCQTFVLTWTSGSKNYSINDNNNVMYNENFNIVGEKTKH